VYAMVVVVEEDILQSVETVGSWASECRWWAVGAGSEPWTLELCNAVRTGKAQGQGQHGPPALRSDD